MNWTQFKFSSVSFDKSAFRFSDDVDTFSVASEIILQKMQKSLNWITFHVNLHLSNTFLRFPDRRQRVDFSDVFEPVWPDFYCGEANMRILWFHFEIRMNWRILVPFLCFRIEAKYTLRAGCRSNQQAYLLFYNFQKSWSAKKITPYFKNKSWNY